MSAVLLNEVSEVVKKKFENCSLGQEINEKISNKPEEYYDKPIVENIKNCPIEGNNGHWNGERGNSKWIPDPDYIPGKCNPDNKTWQEILDKNTIDGIHYKDGEPDFQEISKGNVEIEPFTDYRSDNFDKADIELAEQKGCSPEDVAKWRRENKYTWHECKDMNTMQKVPGEVHNNVSHRGGISEVKIAANNEGVTNNG